MFNRKIISGIVAGSLLVATVPVSAQLLGGGITGSGNGALDAQMSRIGAGGGLATAGQGSLGAEDTFAGARNGASRIGSATRERAANGAAAGKSGAQASKGRLAGAANAGHTLGEKAAESTPGADSAGNTAAEKPQAGLLDNATAGAGAGGAFEREAGGRRVKANGRSDNQVSRDPSGLGLTSTNDGGASLEKVEPPVAEEPAPASDTK